MAAQGIHVPGASGFALLEKVLRRFILTKLQDSKKY
jgi:hypothetical protein